MSFDDTRFCNYYLLTAVLIAKNEGFTVNTLAYCGVLFVSTYLDLVESTVFFVCGVVSALSYAAFDALICVCLIHLKKSVLFEFEILRFQV